MLDDDDRVAAVDEAIENREQARDVGHVQPGRRLVEHIDAAVLVQLARELDALALAARQRAERLAKRQVMQADVAHRFELAGDRRLRKERERFGDGQREDVADRFAVQSVTQHVVLEAETVADLARRADTFEKRQVRVDDARALAVFARTLRVEAEECRVDLVRRGKCFPHIVHHARVGGGIRARRRAHRRLVYDNRIGMLAQECFGDERALPRAGHTRDEREHAFRDIDRDVLEVVVARVLDAQRALARSHVALDRQGLLQVLRRQRVRPREILIAALEHDTPARRPGVRPDVDNIVGDADDVGVVLDDDHGVAFVAELLQQLVEAMHVARVQADARLVEDVHHVDEAAAEVLDHLHAL